MAHNSYQQAGGEDAVLRNEADLLMHGGHQVQIYTKSNHDIRNSIQKLRAAIDISFSQSSFDEISRIICDFRPDILHVHNFFPLLSPSIHYAAKMNKVRVVQTLHNYRLICASATLSREGKVCELCLHGSRLNAVRYKCYRSSAIGSMSLVAMQHRIHRHGSLIDNTDRFIALTQFGKSKFVSGGIPQNKIAVKPNFVKESISQSSRSKSSHLDREKYFLFVGRLSEEKGIKTLVESWKSCGGLNLRIAGDGPLAGLVKENAAENIKVLGRLSATEIADQMSGAAALIFPSTWYEGLPMTVIEAFSLGLPVIASGIGSLAEIVIENVNGLHFEVGNAVDLSLKVRKISSSPELRRHLSCGAHQDYCQKYTPHANLKMLEEIYGGVL